MQQSKKIPALGRVAALGNLYSAHSDKFYPAVNLFSTEVTEDHYDETEISSTDLQYNTSNSITEKLNHFDIGGEVSLSLLAGMIELSGSASYLSEEKENSNFSEMSLLYSTVTVNHQIFSIKRMKINEEVLNDIDGATHVVVGIDWGARCNISCRYEGGANETRQEVEGKLGGLVKKMSVEIKAEGKAESNEKENTETNSFSFNAKSDVLKLSQIPKNFNEAVELAVSLPEHVKEINDGKGIPIDYFLLPLDVVAKVCKKQLNRTVVINKIENDTIQRFKQIAKEMEEAKLDITTLSKSLDKNDNWFGDEYRKIAQESRDKLDILKGQFQSSFQQALEKVRAGRSESSVLQDVLKNVKDITTGLPSIQAFYSDTCAEVKFVVKIIQSFAKLNVTVFGRKQSIFDLDGTNIVLYLPIKINQSQELTDNLNFFQRKAKDISDDNNTEIKYAVQLTSFHPVTFECPVIQKLKDRRTIVNDLLSKEGSLLKLCTIHVERPKILPETSADVTDEKFELKISCPLSYTEECPRARVSWIHDECKKIIKYQVLSKRLKCDCGTFDPRDATFRCSDPNHGIKYYQPNEHSFEEMSKLKKKITNILIVGETGVGKSTWINSIAKYLLYDTLEEAMKLNENTAIIPSHFSHTNEEGETVDVKIGDFKGYDNEDTTASSTQKPTSYLFDIDDENQVKLIDTPGIGDTRGIKKDNENFDMILHHMSYFTEINGICILLKPNTARLGIMLRFCIGELLTHLHKSAAHNIMFCFTNCRGTFYQPGETLPVLKKMLENYKESNVRITKENRFCFDNESFRLLACLQNGIKFSPEDIKAYSASWQRAASETHKLFQYVFKLKPHKTDETLSLNDTRKWIVELSRPIAEIQESIQDRIVQVENKKKELEDMKDGAKDFDELERLSEITVWTPKVVNLDYPRTICRHRNCTEAIKVHGAEILQTPKPCHDHCYINSVTPGRPGDPELRRCLCFKDELTCNVCGHHRGEHQHVKYYTIKVPTKTIDPKTKQMIAKKKDKATIVVKVITDHNERIEAENQEMKTIMEISATFACFLTSYSLAFHNDGVEDHLDYLIDEKTKLGEKEKVKELIKMKKEYQTQKEIIEKAIKSSTMQRTKYDIDVEGAAKLKAELFQLKYNGQTFKKMSEDIARVEADYNYKEVTYITSTKAKRLKGKQNNSHYLHQNNTAPGASYNHSPPPPYNHHYGYPEQRSQYNQPGMNRMNRRNNNRQVENQEENIFKRFTNFVFGQ